MIRLFIFGVIAVVGIIAVVLSLFLVFAVIRWIKQLFSTSKAFANHQQKEWKTRQAKKKAEEAEERYKKTVPDFLRQASKRLKKISRQSGQLDAKWQLLLTPVIESSQDLLQMGLSKPDQAQAVRSFFTVTLKALESFTDALVDMKGGMQGQEEEKARQNIEVFMSDFYKYRAKFESKKRFDFHVMMELVKQRLGK